ncbi:MAG TPA: DUF6531 domain-containing protein, partial [Solirubrobacteraceae bacterium]|nr:DUF6531 domain-containing protein [Solirubrobacteraceae bacterium]
MALFSGAPAAGGDASAALGAGGGPGNVASSPLSGPLSLASLTVPGVQSLAGAAQVAAEAGAEATIRKESPAAQQVRVASRTRFEHLGTALAAEVARKAFPDVIERSTGGPPQLPAGARIAHYLSADAAQLSLPDGKHAVVESTEPMAVKTSSGHFAPVDLSLAKVGSAFESARPAVGVLIPQRLSDGVRLPERGVSLTPADSQGLPLGGSEGAVDRTSVLYANTQTDTDTVVKPTTMGFAADTVLRSVDSPGQLYFRVGLPQGASLAPPRGGSGSVKIVEGGRTVALIRAASATDATGVSVPVSTSVRGDLLALTVASHDGEYQWPIEVDPELAVVSDNYIGSNANWVFQANQAANFTFFPYYTWDEQYNSKSVAPGEYSDIQYHTQGESKIYKLLATASAQTAHGRAKVQLLYNVQGGEGSVENSVTVKEGESEGIPEGKVKLCPNASESECSPSAGHNGNLAWFRIEATEPAQPEYLSGKLSSTDVFISQEKAPEASFNESEATIDSGRANVLFGPEHGPGTSQVWLGPMSGAFEVKAHDPGIGVSAARITVGSWHQEEQMPCLGVQCNESYSSFFTYNTGMPDGEYPAEWQAWNFVGGSNGSHGLEGKRTQSIKVDATPPHSIGFTGMAEQGAEISATPHRLIVKAVDGTQPTPSSGVKSIAVAIDGGNEVVTPGSYCSSGECTANGEYTLNAENLSEGMHRLVVTATDNAGNAAPKEFIFDVRHGSPVPAGPGAVDPTTGQFKLSATDVSLAGAGGVSRVYESRNLTVGAEGPLGPQWAVSLGDEGLTVLPSGSVVLAGSAGGHTTFIRNEKGEFESPLGDGNVKIEAKEKETGKGITEYLMTDAKAGTSTTFKQPAGTESTVPLYSNQFGSGSEVAQLNHPVGAAIDASGNVWIADYNDNRVLKFSPAGVLLAAYGSYGSPLREFESPYGLAINQRTGNVYVSDMGNHRIVELDKEGKFLMTFGWGVTDGKQEWESCSSSIFFCRAGISGSGNGQLSEPKGVAVDASGNVWVVDPVNARVQEFAENGSYLNKFGSYGGGEGQFNVPLGIALSGGNLYVSEYGNNRVQELSTAGKFISQIGTGKAGSGNGEFNAPRGIAADPRTGNLYVADAGNNRVQEFSAAGSLIAKFGSAGSGTEQLSEPKGVAVSFSGGVYVTDYNNNRVEEWSRPTWLPKHSEGPLKSTTAAYAYMPVEVEGKVVVEPTEALAPTPSGVTCGAESEKELEVKELKKGCRALTFKYAEKTGATGERESEWGEYAGRLVKVSLVAYNPTTKTMPETPVAEYAYDSRGRLRAEWDPRISPAPLKTTYGYDSEGHVVSVSPPGQEPWLMHYGALAGDPSMGRLLSVTRPAAATPTALKEQ